jgi:hypothetical protein
MADIVATIRSRLTDFAICSSRVEWRSSSDFAN